MKEPADSPRSTEERARRRTVESQDPVVRGLAPLWSDPMLRPVLAVGVLILATFGAAVVVLAVADRNLAAMALLALLSGMTLYAVDSARRGHADRNVVWLLAIVWVLSLAGGLLYARWLPA